MLFFEKHNYKSVEFLGNFLYKFEGLNEKNSFHYDKIVSTVFLPLLMRPHKVYYYFLISTHTAFSSRISVLNCTKSLIKMAHVCSSVNEMPSIGAKAKYGCSFPEFAVLSDIINAILIDWIA